MCKFVLFVIATWFLLAGAIASAQTPWSPLGYTGAIAVTTSSTQITLPTTTALPPLGLVVKNTGSNLAFVALGDITVVASSTNGTPVAPGETTWLNATGKTTLAAIGSGGSTTIYATIGTGQFSSRDNPALQSGAPPTGPAGGGLSGTYPNPAVASVPSSVANSPFALSISLNDPTYGAVGDDTADDTTALNAALTAVRTAISALPSPGGTVTGEVHVTCKTGSVFKVTGSLNGTGINTYPQLVPVVFDLAGCTFDAQFTSGNTGKAIFDFMGDSYITINDVNLGVSTLTNLPGTGMQFGRVTCSAPTTCTPAYHNKITRPAIHGRYSVAGLYMRSSELSSITDPDIINSSTSGTAHGVVFDGINHFSIITAATDQATADTAVPQNDDVIRGGHISSAGGSPVWVGNIYRLTLDGTYTLSQNATTPTEGVRLYAGVGEIDLFDGRIHSEPNLAVTTLPHTIIIEGGEGSGFAVNDTLTLTGGTFTTAAVITVNTVGSNGQILTFTVSNGGAYSVNPSNPLAYTTSGSGVGAKFTGTFSAGALQSAALPTPTIKGLKLEDQYSFATSSLIGLDPGLPSATILDLVAKTPNFGTPAALVFTTADAANLTLVDPVVDVPATGNWVRPATMWGGRVCAGITSTPCSPGTTGFTTNSGSGKVIVGDMGIGGGYAGISADGTASATDYSIASAPGDPALYLNRKAGSAIHFKENNGTDQMTIAAGGRGTHVISSSPPNTFAAPNVLTDFAFQYGPKTAAQQTADYNALVSGYDALEGIATIPSGSTILGTSGIAGYIENFSTVTNGVGIYGQAQCAVTNSLCWGGNIVIDDSVTGGSESATSVAGTGGVPSSTLTVASTSRGTPAAGMHVYVSGVDQGVTISSCSLTAGAGTCNLSGNVTITTGTTVDFGSQTGNIIQAWELDALVYQPNTFVEGVSINGGFRVQPFAADAFIVNCNGCTGVTKWSNAFWSVNGSSTNFAVIGDSARTQVAGLNSQPILWEFTDTSGSTQRSIAQKIVSLASGGDMDIVSSSGPANYRVRNASSFVSLNAAGSADLDLLHADSSNIEQLGSGVSEIDVSSGLVKLTNATSNFIQWSNNGAGVPTDTTRSVGTKLVLFSGLTGSSDDYAIGIASNQVWFSVPSSSGKFSFYQNLTDIMDIGTTAVTITGLNFLVTGGVYQGIRLQVHRITSGSSDNSTSTDVEIIWNSNSGAAKTENIPTCSSSISGSMLEIKDEFGDAATNTITVTPASGTIEGQSTFILATNKAAARFVCDGSSNWVGL